MFVNIYSTIIKEENGYFSEYKFGASYNKDLLVYSLNVQLFHYTYTIYLITHNLWS